MPAHTLSFQRTIPVRREVDIFIAGGGPSGVAAALAATRQGQSVYLVESGSCFGGMGTSGMVPIFLFLSDGVNFVAGGIGAEIYQNLKHSTHLYLDDPAGSISIDAEVLKRVYDEMLVASQVSFTFQTQLIGVEVRAGSVTHAICAAKSGIFAVAAKMFIDCTGDGDLAAWAGAPFEKGDQDGSLMPGTLCSLWSHIDWDVVNQHGVRDDSQLPRAFQDGVFTYRDRHLPGMFRTGEDLGGGNLVHTFGVDATDEESITRALLWGRKGQLEYEHYYKNYLRGFEAMRLVGTGSMLGIRETRRILGDYLLCLEDFKRRAIFEDEIGRFSYPVDIHPSKPSNDTYAQFEEEFQNLRYKPGESYGIPYRSLIPRGLDNVLVAGRCISADRYIQGSVRVMAGCFITGQAAGIAAALAAGKNLATREISIVELKHNLKKLGAYLPNA